MVIVWSVCSCDCRWPSALPLKGGPCFEPFPEWGGHRYKGQNSLQLATKPVEENLHQEELQHQLAAKGLVLGEMRPAEDPTLEVNCALAFLRCGKWAERKQNVTLCLMVFCTPSCKHCLFFPYIPAWNHTLVVCCVISFGAERRQENFLLDGLKGSVLYTIWVTRTMSDQTAAKSDSAVWVRQVLPLTEWQEAGVN